MRRVPGSYVFESSIVRLGSTCISLEIDVFWSISLVASESLF